MTLGNETAAEFAPTAVTPSPAADLARDRAGEGIAPFRAAPFRDTGALNLTSIPASVLLGLNSRP